jgi:hypothetical protein
MAVSKVDEKFYEITGRRLENTSQLRLFNVLHDNVDNVDFMNIFKSYSINDSILSNTLYYDTYEVGHNEWWDTIARKLYDNSYLWWILPLMNGVSNPFEGLEEGDNIKVLKAQYIYIIFKELEAISDL